MADAIASSLFHEFGIDADPADDRWGRPGHSEVRFDGPISHDLRSALIHFVGLMSTKYPHVIVDVSGMEDDPDNPHITLSTNVTESKERMLTRASKKEVDRTTSRRRGPMLGSPGGTDGVVEFDSQPPDGPLELDVAGVDVDPESGGETWDVVDKKSGVRGKIERAAGDGCGETPSTGSRSKTRMNLRTR